MAVYNVGWEERLKQRLVDDDIMAAIAELDRLRAELGRDGYRRDDLVERIQRWARECPIDLSDRED